MAPGHGVLYLGFKVPSEPLVFTETADLTTSTGFPIQREARNRHSVPQSFADVVRAESNLHVVIAVMNGIGDAFLAIPAIRYVIDLVGCDRVTIFGSGKYRETVFGELYRYLKNADAPYAVDSLIRAIPAGRRLCWISLNSHKLPDVEQRAIRSLMPEFFWGYRRGVRANAPNVAQLRRSDQYFRILGEDRMPDNVRRAPAIPEAATRWADELIAREVPAGRPLIAVHAETPSSDKEWPFCCWLELAARLAPRAELILLGTQDQLLSSQQPFLRPPPTWNTQVAVLSHAAVFVGVDSCWAHVADSLNCPGAVLFERVPFSQWSPRNASLVALDAGNGNLSAVAPVTVLEIIEKALS